MAGKTKTARVDQALKAAFGRIEAQPAPEALKAHVERLTGAPPTRKAKN